MKQFIIVGLFLLSLIGCTSEYKIVESSKVYSNVIVYGWNSPHQLYFALDSANCLPPAKWGKWKAVSNSLAEDGYSEQIVGTKVVSRLDIKFNRALVADETVTVKLFVYGFTPHYNYREYTIILTKDLMWGASDISLEVNENGGFDVD